MSQNSCGPWWKKPICAGAFVFITGMLTVGVLNFAMEGTSSTEFCVSCHSMKGNFEEYKKTVHYENRSGVRAECQDCHVPKDFGPKLVAKVIAVRDVWSEMVGNIDTQEKFDAHRWTMAQRVWSKMEASDSRECRSCHDYDSMNSVKQDPLAARKHASAQERGKTCIECHQGLAHTMPEEPVEEVPTEAAQGEETGQDKSS